MERTALRSFRFNRIGLMPWIHISSSVKARLNQLSFCFFLIISRGLTKYLWIMCASIRKYLQCVRLSGIELLGIGWKVFLFLKFSGNGQNYEFKSYTSERCNCYFVHVRHPLRFKSRNDSCWREMDDCSTGMQRFITSEGFDTKFTVLQYFQKNPKNNNHWKTYFIFKSLGSIPEIFL